MRILCKIYRRANGFWFFVTSTSGHTGTILYNVTFKDSEFLVRLLWIIYSLANVTIYHSNAFGLAITVSYLVSSRGHLSLPLPLPPLKILDTRWRIRERITSKVVVALLNFFSSDSVQAHKGTELRLTVETIGMKVFWPILSSYTVNSNKDSFAFGSYCGDHSDISV